MQQILHTSLQRSNIAVGKIGGQSAIELHNISFKHCRRNVHVRNRACDVGGKLTHLISRVPDTHYACRLCMCSDPLVTLVLNQCAEEDHAPAHEVSHW